MTDPTLPLDGVEATREIATLGLGYTFELFGDLALLTALVPYAWTDVSANVLGTARSVSRSGLADARFRLSVHLRGNPAMRAGEFAKAPRRTIVGTGVTVAAPAGQYDGAKLINLGNNRWAFKPEAGVSVPMGRWDFDAYGGVVVV
ncbi:MAG: transporter, partial [Acidobacteria bacterium]